MLFGAEYGLLSFHVRCENMEHYGKCNDSLVADPAVKKTLAKGEMLGEVVRQTLAKQLTD